MLLKRDLKKMREAAPYGRLIFHKIIFQKIISEERLEKTVVPTSGCRKNV
jgi:hypothetical protein